MDEALRDYLESQFGTLLRGVDGLTQRVGELTQRVDGLTQRVETLELGQRELRVLVEQQSREIRSVSESHQILYDGMTRREDNLRGEMRELQRLLMVWGESSTRRLGAVEDIASKLVAAARG